MYTKPKKLAQQQKLSIAKLKKIKSIQQILSKTNHPILKKKLNADVSKKTALLIRSAW